MEYDSPAHFTFTPPLSAFSRLSKILYYKEFYLLVYVYFQKQYFYQTL